MFGRFIISAALAACLAGPVLAESTTLPVVFAAGMTGTAVHGQVTGGDTADYTLTASAGQRMTVRMNTDNSSAYFNVYAPGAVPGESTALFIGSSAGNSADLVLPANGSYLIRTYLMGNASQTGQTAKFSLTIDVAFPGQSTPVESDALAGGPDYWQVTGISDRLNIRAEASTNAAVVGTAVNGTILRNQGCQQVEDRTWCKVETTSGTPINGWTVNQYLTEGSAPAGTASAAAGASAGASTSATTTAIAQAVAQATAPAAASGSASAVTGGASASAATGTPAPATTPSGATRPPVPTRTKITPATANPPANPAAAVAGTAAPVASPSVVSATKPAPKPVKAQEIISTGHGTLACSTELGMPAQECEFLASREGEGNTTVAVTRPDGTKRELRFIQGAPAPVDGQRTERRGRRTIIDIGNERYEVTDTMIFGD